MTRRCKMTPCRPKSGALLDFWMLSGRPTTLSPAVACQAKERYRNSPRWLTYGILHRLELLMYLQFPYGIRTTLYAMFLVAGSTEVNAVDLNRDGWIDFSRGRIQYPYGIYTTYDAPLHQLLQQPLAAPIPEHFWICGGCPAARPRCPQLWLCGVLSGVFVSGASRLVYIPYGYCIRPREKSIHPSRFGRQH